MTNDLTYDSALAEAEERHEVLLGPVPCHRCRAWVEWAGVEWLALGTEEQHECAPFRAPALAPRSAGLTARRMEPVVPDLPAIPWQLVLGALAMVMILIALTRPTP